MKILLTGSEGQVGTALVHALSAGHHIIATTRATLDIADYRSVDQVVAARPDIVIHPAAWTNVDGCALDPPRAYRANGLGTRHMALACRRLDIPLLYISTNEVFDGHASSPYYEWDAAHPVNPYGQSKWAGEQFVRELCARFFIVRIAWVFGGPRNFVRTILRLATERPSLPMVTDEIGNPTYAPDLARAVGTLITDSAYGTYHFINAGYCSRFEWAAEILRQSGASLDLEPITLDQFKRASTPPRFAPLHNFVGANDLLITLPPWQDALARFLAVHRGPGTP
ncbi:MAG: dTDP-4-dehydrorhamnose reductase [Herpetosiphon sp.]